MRHNTYLMSGIDITETVDEEWGWMLDALTVDKKDQAKPITFREVTIEEKKKFLCKNVRNLVEKNDRLDIGYVLVINQLSKLIKENSEGCLINLDILDPNIINQMYSLMVYKLSKDNNKQ